MSNAVVDRLREERDEARSAAVALAESENFNPEDETYVALKTRAAQLDSRVGELAGLMEARKNSDALDGRLARGQQRSNTSSTTATPVSFGEAFVRSEAFLDYAGSPRGRMPKLEMDMETRALPTGLSDVFGSGKLALQPTSVSVQAPPAPTPLLDNVNRVQVTGNAIEYVSWAKSAGSAAIVAEKAAKPSVEFAPTVVAGSLENIAAYTQLTRQLIEDAPAVRSFIDGELIREILREEEEQAATALAAATLPTATGADLLAAIRVGVGTVQAAGYAPNAVLLNPADWADLDNAVMSSTLIGPQIRQNFWGLTPIPATSQPAGTATVGDFRTGVTQFFRSEVALYITDSHADTFLSNVFTLLAERRAKTAVVRPQALVEVTAGA